MWLGMMGFGGLMIILWIVIIGLIVWGVVVLVRRSSSGSKPNAGEEEDALEIAKKRYARGEISKKEFEQIKKDLK